MSSNKIILLNFEEVRRRSINLWHGIPEKYYHWRPDEAAMSCIEMVRHVLESEYDFKQIIENRGSAGLNYKSPWESRPFSTIADELAFARPFRLKLLDLIASFTEGDLYAVKIVRAELGQERQLGDYLLRMAYHEAVHSGQLLSYLRTLNAERPTIWG